MKKVILILAILLCLIFPIKVFANMAAPTEDSIATTISFEKNEDISVTKEVLDVTFNNYLAEIKATYTMKNKQEYFITTPSMFITPNIEGEEVSVTLNGEEIAYTIELYYTFDISSVSIEDWEFVIVEDEYDYYDLIVQAINFELSFEAFEEVEVVVSYTYLLGGYPERTDNNKYGSLSYYLAPANMWEDFSDLTINLYLDSNMPVLKSSNIDFEEIADKTYQYKSDSIPVDILEITIGLNKWQSFIGYLKNPYLIFAIILMLPTILPILIITIIIIVVIVIIVRKRKKKKLYNNKE